MIGEWRLENGNRRFDRRFGRPRFILHFPISNSMTDTIDRLKTALADRYTIEFELGAGGMATVYLAEGFPALKRGLGYGA